MPDLKRLDPGCRVQGPLLVVEVDHRSYGDGKDCILLTLADASGRIGSAPFWSERRATVAGLGRGDPVEVTGKSVSIAAAASSRCSRSAHCRAPTWIGACSCPR